MELSKMTFRRKFSVNPYKTLRLPLGEMSLYKDFVNDKRGDPYPVTFKTGDVCEKIENAKYTVSAENGGYIARFLTDFFPIASYELEICEISSAKVGFSLEYNGQSALCVMADGEKIEISCGEAKNVAECALDNGDILSLTFRTGAVSVYVDKGDRPLLVCDNAFEELRKFSSYDVFTKSHISVACETQKNGRAVTKNAQAYLCGGLSHADMKPMRYEDGTPIIEGGRVFLTMSSRLEAQTYQSIISWNPTLCDFRLEGAMLFDVGDGMCCSDVASSVVYDRNCGKWYIWMCSFSHGHILARGELLGDPRYGVQIVDVKLLDKPTGDDLTQFAGFKGDEDPDLCFIDGKWHLTVCRLEPADGYHYYHFVSDSPFDGFKFVDRTLTGEKTGGMFTKIDGEYYFVCGSDFKTRARYDIYKYNDFSKYDKLICDYDDGGFRGWGTVFSVPVGSRIRHFHITFDRHNASGYNWSYGNLYVYEAYEYSK